jgi:hypothetical protein
MKIKYGKIIIILVFLSLICLAIYLVIFKKTENKEEENLIDSKNFYMNKLILDTQEKMKNYDYKYFDPLVLSQYHRQHELNVFKITIRKNKISISNLITYNKPEEYINSLKETLKTLEEKYILPNCVFLLSLEDNESKFDPLIPVFMNSSKNDSSILHPNWFFYNKERLKDVRSEVTPWNKKIDKAVWRGSDSGRTENYGDESTISRVFIANNTDEENFDTGFYKFEKENKKKLKNRFKLKKYLSPSEQSKFKFIISTDGYGGTHGLYWALSSGSCVLNNTKYKQWFSDLFSNGNEFVSYDDTEENNNIEDKVENLINNDKIGRITAEDSLYKSNIIFEENFVLEYFYQTIKLYAYKQNLHYDLN